MLQLQLRENQMKAYEALAARIEYGCEHGTICLVGDFQSGKTTVVKRLLAERFGTLETDYVNLNLCLLKELEKHSATINYAGAKAKIHLLMQMAVEDLLQQHFSTHDLLVLDAIEVIYPYALNLVAITNRFARDGKYCIICVPENTQQEYRLAFSWGLADVVHL